MSLLALAIGLGTTAPAVAGQADFMFDFSKAHDYMGVGAQVWPWGNKEHMDTVTQMLRDMNARFVRVSIGGKIPDEQALVDQSVEQYLAVIEANDTPKQRQNFMYFRDKMNSLGVGLHLSAWMMPKNWMIPGSKNPNFPHVDRRRINDYANLIVAQLIYR